MSVSFASEACLLLNINEHDVLDLFTFANCSNYLLLVSFVAVHQTKCLNAYTLPLFLSQCDVHTLLDVTNIEIDV